jgi:hypothetical protein
MTVWDILTFTGLAIIGGAFAFISLTALAVYIGVVLVAIGILGAR